MKRLSLKNLAGGLLTLVGLAVIYQPLTAPAALLFFSTGLSIALLSFFKNRYLYFLTQIVAFGAVLLGILVIVGHLFDIDFLYSGYSYSPLATPTALGYILLGIGLKMLSQKNNALQHHPQSVDKKILLLSAIILFCIASIAGLFGFTISAHQDESTKQLSLQKLLQDKIFLLQDNIHQALLEMTAITQDPALLKLLFNLPAMPYQDSQVITRLLLNSTFSAIQIQDPEGKTIYSGGRFMKHPLSTIPLDFPYGAQLLWKNGFRLQLSTTLHHAGKIHTLMLQWPLQTFNQFFPSTKDFNGQPTLLCFLNNIQKLTCLPPQTNLQLLSASLSTHEWQELLRLTQQSLPGIIKNSSRSQKNSLLIYSPLGQQKIGLVIKPDLEEMYRPLRKELFWVILVLLLAISFGAFLLYWRVSPLVRKLYENEAQLQSAFTYSAIGMAMVSPEGYWLKVNSALCQILGYTEAEFLKMNFQSITYPADLSSSLEKTKQALSRKIDHYTLAKRYFHKNGQLVWALLHVSLIRNAAQHPLYFIAQIQDITEQKQFQEKLNYQAYYDTLTGLANRSLLEHELHQLITTCQKNNKQFAVLFMDLDYFKKVNDSLGHDAGDQLLVSVAERLKSYARKTDIVARLGGDEFVVVLPEIDDYRAAAAFAEKIRLLVVNPFIIRGRELFITASFGISFYPLDGNSYATLIKNADQALYQAKERGRNNYQFCDPERSVTLQGNNF